MLRNVLRLAIVLLMAHALYRFVPAYVHYQQFKDAVAEAALFSKDRSDTEIVDRVMVLAERYRIPLDREAVQVTRDTHVTYINVAYDEAIEWIPSYRRPWAFTVDVEGWHARAPAGSGPYR